jgi:RNA polymerase sigma-70 factor (ECF subfamily)
VTPPLPDLTDGELAKLALNGQQRAYRELMRRHRDGVYRLVLAQIADRDETVDVTQEAFISAFAALARFDRARSFRAWMARIAINKCHDWARRRAVRRFFTFARPMEDALDIPDAAASPEDQLVHAAAHARLLAAIASLPPKLKDVLILRTIEDFSQAEVADALGVTTKAVEMRLYRARAALADLLRD